MHRGLMIVGAAAAALVAPAFGHRTNDEAGDRMLSRVREAYKAIETYHAAWTVEFIIDPAMEEELKEELKNRRMEIEVVFERRSERFLVSVWARERKGDLWAIGNGAQVVVNDGTNLSAALFGFPGEAGWQRKVRALPDPLTYRDIRRSLFSVYLFDLPLLFTDDPTMALAEWLQGTPGEVTALEPEPGDAKKRPGLRVRDESGETTAVVRLDPQTHRLLEMRYEGAPFRLKLKQVKVNEPLDEALFDFEAQLKRLQEQKD